jgi:hypothetical protein
MKPRNEIVRQVASMFNQDKLSYEIDDYLKNEGVGESDFAAVTDEAYTLYVAKSKKKRKLLWISLTVLTLILFLFLIPTSIYNTFPFIISVAGAALFTAFLVQSIADFRSFQELNTKNKEEQDWRHTYTPFSVLPGIAMIFIFYFNFLSNKTSELKEYGEKITGTIVNGSSFRMGRGKSFEIIVQFVTKDGKTRIASESIGESEFRKFYKGQQVELIYSTKNPGMVELLTNKTAIQDYTNSEERDVKIQDLIDLTAGQNVDVDNFLNKINYGWKLNCNDSIWINERKKAAIRINQPFGITYISYDKAV